MKPEEVLHNWDVPALSNIDLSKIVRATSGLLNKSYLLFVGKDSDELFVLQRVHPAVSMDGALDNYFHVTQFLHEKNLISQKLIPTVTGKLFVDTEAGWRWRLLRGVNGEIYSTTTDPVIANEGGQLLGQFHAVISHYPSELKAGKPMFQYEVEIEKLHQFEKQLMADPDESIRYATALLLKMLPRLLLPSDLPTQIIHTDPKISNFLFSKDKKGVCMIDFDTVQKLNPLYDIGDALRSWCGQKEDDPQNHFDIKLYDAFLKGYMTTSKGLLSQREQLLIPQATKLIMLGLATRFLNDYVEDSYFGWDETKYNSRKAHNKARTMGQLSLYQSFAKLT